MSNTIEFTQGQVLGATAANEALEPVVEGIVAAYLQSLGDVFAYLSDTAEKLADDGLTLADFAKLLAGADL